MGGGVWGGEGGGGEGGGDWTNSYIANARLSIWIFSKYLLCLLSIGLIVLGLYDLQYFEVFGYYWILFSHLTLEDQGVPNYIWSQSIE